MLVYRVEVKICQLRIENHRSTENNMAIIFGLALAGFGLFNVWHSIQLRTKGIFTIGTVSNVKMQGSTPVIFVSFKTLKKKLVVFKAGGWTSIVTSPFYQLGNPVPVLYDPHNPTDAIIYTFDFMWALPLALTGVGLFFIYYGFTH